MDMYQYIVQTAGIMCTNGICDWLSIDTLDWRVDRYSMDILIDIWSTLDWHLNQQMADSQPSVDRLT